MNYTVENVIPVDDQILVKLDGFHKIATKSKDRTSESIERERKFYKNKANIGKNFIYEEDDFVMKDVMINGKYRTGVIVAVPNYTEGDRLKFEVGQRIVFEEGNQIPFDLLTESFSEDIENTDVPVLVRKFHVRAIIK